MMKGVVREKPKVLIVDDVAENLHALMGILREEYAVIAATNGSKALELATTNPMPDLILLDIRMPDLDGYEVLRQLKESPQTEQIPVIFVTGLADEVNEAQGLDMGAVDYITKPVNPVTTLLRVRHQITLKQTQSDLLKSQQESIHAGRLASIGFLASGLAHEINTPAQYISNNLAFIQESMETIQEMLDSAQSLTESTADTEEAKAFGVTCPPDDIEFLLEELPKAISQSRDGIAHISKIVQSMKEFSPHEGGEKMRADIHKILDSIITVTHNASKEVASFKRCYDSSLSKILCNVDELRQVFLNLIINSIQAIESSQKQRTDLGEIVITTESEDEFVSISIADSGDGVPEEISDRIFDPFFTTKDVGEGSGQGLNICYEIIVNKYGGAIETRNVPDSGAIFTVRLPVKKKKNILSSHD
jgi:signal transduction histidine kinase